MGLENLSQSSENRCFRLSFLNWSIPTPRRQGSSPTGLPVLSYTVVEKGKVRVLQT